MTPMEFKALKPGSVVVSDYYIAVKTDHADGSEVRVLWMTKDDGLQGNVGKCFRHVNRIFEPMHGGNLRPDGELCV